MKRYDLIVIGAGAGGLNVASFANRVGLSVLLVDRSDRAIGGDCLNAGCIPSKALIHVGKLIAAGGDAARFGVSQRGAVDWAAVRAYIHEKQEVIRAHENAAYFREAGMDVVLGEASFTGPRSVRVGEEAYEAARIVIATGSRPRELTFENPNGVPVYTNETIFTAPTFPQRLLVVGGGPIGFELGQAFARLGAEVTIINRDEHWLGKERPEAAAVLVEQVARDGVRLVPNVVLTNVADGVATLAPAEDAAGTARTVPCDAVLVAIGRIPNLESLNLASAGIKQDDRGGLVLDATLRTTNSRVYAVGDAAGQHQFTHAAEVHAALVLKNLFLPRLFQARLDTEQLGWVTYTEPELATFGRSAEALTEAGVPFRTLEESFAHSDRAIVDEAEAGKLWLHVSPRSGRILGGTMVGRNAGELVAELMLAGTHGMTLRDLFARVYPYPTAARINRRVAANFLGKSLTAGLRRLLRMLYRIS